MNEEEFKKGDRVICINIELCDGDDQLYRQYIWKTGTVINYAEGVTYSMEVKLDECDTGTKLFKCSELKKI